MKRRAFLSHLVTALAALPLLAKARGHGSPDPSLAYGRHPDCGGFVEHKVSYAGEPVSYDKWQVHPNTIGMFEAAAPIEAGMLLSLHPGECNTGLALVRPARETDWIVGIAQTDAHVGENVAAVVSGWSVGQRSYSLRLTNRAISDPFNAAL
jgi:hypothetical protein